MEELRYDFSDSIRKILEEGRKSAEACQELSDTALKFGKQLVEQLAAKYSFGIEAKIDRTALPLGQGDAALKRMGLPPLAQEYVYTLSANVPQYDEKLPIVAYQVDPTRCYPCVIQNGSQNYFCSDLQNFEDGLNRALADNSLKVTMALDKIAEKHKVDPACMVN